MSHSSKSASDTEGTKVAKNAKAELVAPQPGHRRKKADPKTSGVATIWTIGHSTRPIEHFLGLLAGYRIETIADVRSFPGSRKYPQYGKEALAATLSEHGIGYRWFQILGGRRRVARDSPNVAWRNASFRAYADYMSTSEFAQGLTELIELASQSRIALMCAEAVWWRCHRSMISDALCVRGIKVVHIMDAKNVIVHPMTMPARVVRGRLTYALP
jgi:uncharacterized protein (DUF488 family)